MRHDLWDYDVPAQPILADVQGRAAVIVMTKMGHIFVLDRESGEPILPVEERPVPASLIPEEKAAATQIFPVLPRPLLPSKVTEDDIWGINETERQFVLNKLIGKRNEGIFTPPSLEGTLIFPGTLGGSNWSGGSYDPMSETLFVNINRIATIVTLIPRAKLASVRAAHPGAMIAEQIGTPYAVKVDWLFGHNRVPGTKPPWGVLTAINLKTGEIRWESPLGQTQSLRGRAGSEAYGSLNLGGSFATSTGLIFIAAGQDAKLRAYDTENGQVLWKTGLPAGGNAAPMSYLGPQSKRQFIVQCAGGHGGLGSPLGDYVCAFVLPKQP